MQRIVSLVPSQTELLFDLGVGDRVVGVTKFCVHPAEALKTKTVVGGTKNFRFDVIENLRPDLILANKEENCREGIERLAEKFPVWMSDIYDLPDALAMIRTVGVLTDTQAAADTLARDIESRFAALAPAGGLRVAYLIWQNPLMAVGSRTFVHDMLTRAGYANVFADRPRYPEITPADLHAAAPDCIFLSSEPFPFREKHLTTFARTYSNSRVMRVDGEMFSWYGSRLRQAAGYLERLQLSLVQA
ncbi:MAG: helical backbone metal receptor [Cytophagales bacterium]|nr:helical backbone metal receptor [Cytophagales bacterium]